MFSLKIEGKAKVGLWIVSSSYFFSSDSILCFDQFANQIQSKIIYNVILIQCSRKTGLNEWSPRLSPLDPVKCGAATCAHSHVGGQLVSALSPVLEQMVLELALC